MFNVSDSLLCVTDGCSFRPVYKAGMEFTACAALTN